jgi:phosphoribosyl-dephospho-CoA transferase
LVIGGPASSTVGGRAQDSRTLSLVTGRRSRRCPAATRCCVAAGQRGTADCHTGQPRTKLLPALLALDAAAAIFEEQGYGDLWGPVGSVGFELASGLPSVSAQSDLDLVLDAPEPIEVRDAAALFTALGRLSARVDLLLETPLGAVALSDYAGGKRVVLLRTHSGAHLVTDPWHASWAAEDAG